MTEKARYRISLRITHPSIRHLEISRQLGLEPDFSYTAGDARLSPKGDALGGTREASFWCHEARSGDVTLELAIASFSQELARSKGFLDSLSSTGGAS